MWYEPIITSAHHPLGHSSPACARSPLKGSAVAAATTHRYMTRLTRRRNGSPNDSRTLYNCRMLKATLGFVALSFTALASGAEPIVDNEHVTIWDTAVALPPSLHDFVEVSLSRKGTASFGHRGDTPGKAGSRSIVIDLKDLPVTPLANETGYPLAFPRKRARKLLENEEVVVWDYPWRPGEATPMHFHDKDAVVVYEATGAIKSTTPDGKSVVSEINFGGVRFNPRGRTHTEILVSGKAHAVITELK